MHDLRCYFTVQYLAITTTLLALIMQKSSTTGHWQLPDHDAVRAAARRISNSIKKTPIKKIVLDGREVICKCEFEQVTGSFKARGASNALAMLPDGQQRVITASAGNHGLGVAHAAAAREISATVYVSRDARAEKIRKLEKMGAEVLLHGADYDEAEAHAMAQAKESDVPFIHAFEDPAVIAGQGTAALELIEQCENMDSLLVPVGGGGLVSGCAIALKEVNPELVIYGVQPVASAPMKAAMEAGEIVETPIGKTSCDALAGRFAGEITLTVCRDHVEEILTVSEGAILTALVFVERQLRRKVEPSAVAGLAAVLEHGDRIPGITATLITGGNISAQEYSSLFGEI